MLHLQLLGNFRLSVDDQLVSRVDSPRLQALLAYLLLQRQAPVLRRQVAFSLWPDSTEAQARNNLRQALPDLARFVRANKHRLHWRPSAPVRVDVIKFETGPGARRTANGHRGLWRRYAAHLPSSGRARLCWGRVTHRPEAATSATPPIPVWRQTRSLAMITPRSARWCSITSCGYRCW